ncbi:chromate transporter [Mycoplana sp. MJR14]|uniref:chromate transporter n=1 Tax=Mycoplana sp. MJR14 TaxID=3032583 RepID=UPI0023D9C3F5|nr:chromate transporter [Mycoplana sp. MJR14]MDF1635373.1 chromate transporter [Mycoplana sp. MJR14]
MDDDKLLNLIMMCIPLSLVSFGGGQTIIASLQHQTVDVQNMLSGARFTDLYAISRAAPGPGTMIVSLVGWEVSGLLGAVLATLAIFVPSSILICAVGSYWQRHRGRPWAIAAEKGLAPVAVGLIFAGVFAVGRSAQFSPVELATTLVAGAILLRTKVGPYPLLAAAGALYFALSIAGQV